MARVVLVERVDLLPRVLFGLSNLLDSIEERQLPGGPLLAKRYATWASDIHSAIDQTPDKELTYIEWITLILSWLKSTYTELNAYNDTLKVNPNDARAWSNKGGILGTLGRMEESLEAFNSSLKVNPALAETWYNKGVALEAVGRDKAAAESYKKAKELGFIA